MITSQLYGELPFARQNAKTLEVLINEDSYVEGNENLTLALSNPSGVSLGGLANASVTITDNIV